MFLKKKNYLSKKDLNKIGFMKIGKNVLISKYANFYNPKKIIIGSNCRIDDYVIFSTNKKKIVIGDNVKVGRSCHINGSGGINIKKNVILSSFVTLHSSNHIYSKRNNKNIEIIKYGQIEIEENSIIGSNSIVVGPCKINKNGVLGTMSFLKTNIKKNELFAGIPAKKINK